MVGRPHRFRVMFDDENCVSDVPQTLENLDQVLRRRRQMRLKIKAMSSEARASAMIIGSLPFVMFTILFFLKEDDGQLNLR